MSRYRLAEGVVFQEEPGYGGGILLIPYPRRMIRLSAGGCRAIRELCRPERDEGITEQKIADFGRNLEEQGVLVRVFAEPAERDLPFVSVIIPTYDRGAELAKCLESVLALEYPQDKLEIIIADDASPVPAQVVRGKARIIRMKANVGPGAARNTAAQAAKGDILAFIDDDCLADRFWLKELVPGFRDPAVAAVGGRVEPASLTGPVERYEKSQSPLTMGDRQRLLRADGAYTYLATCNLLVRKASFLAIGGFDQSLRVGEDVDLCWRLLAGGALIYYLPWGTIYHHHRSKLGSFLQRRFCYGQSEACLSARYPRKRRALHYFPGNGLVTVLAVLAWFVGGALLALATGMLLVLWQLLRQILLKRREARARHCDPGWLAIIRGVMKSQGTALYLYSQHFSRYYSVFFGIISLFALPGLLALCAATQLLPALVQYRLKKPPLDMVRFCFYFILEDLFYQFGVYSGCIRQRNWHPLGLKPVVAGEKEQ